MWFTNGKSTQKIKTHYRNIKCLLPNINSHCSHPKERSGTISRSNISSKSPMQSLKYQQIQKSLRFKPENTFSLIALLCPISVVRHLCSQLSILNSWFDSWPTRNRPLRRTSITIKMECRAHFVIKTKTYLHKNITTILIFERFEAKFNKKWFSRGDFRVFLELITVIWEGRDI